MARLLGTLLILLAIIAAVGFYRGWFSAQTSSGSNESTVTVTVQKDAIRQDADAATEKIKDKLSPATAPATNP